VLRDARRKSMPSPAFDAMPALYIADGHHRSAAASRVAAARHQQGREQSADAFLSVIFRTTR
jgi:uncharacterized protein (DUF1015 family)